MTLARALVRNAAVGVAVADKPEDLKTFLHPGCAAAIWRRQLMPEFQSWIDALDLSMLPQGRIVLRPGAVPAAVTALCDVAQTPDRTEREQLIGDISAMAEIFANLMQTPYVRLRLQAVTTNACRKFHIDAIKARLVCTYRGQGTQYGISHRRAGSHTRLLRCDRRTDPLARDALAGKTRLRSAPPISTHRRDG